VRALRFAAVSVAARWRRGFVAVGMRRSRDLAFGVVSGVATALTGMSGPPVLIYLMLTGAAPRMLRATLFAFFAGCYAATLAAYIATVGVPGTIWLTSATLAPFAAIGGIVRPPGR